MSKLNDVSSIALLNLLGTRNKTVAPTSSTNFLIKSGGASPNFLNAAQQYCINGIKKYKAAVTDQALTYGSSPTGAFYTLPAGKTCYIVVGLDDTTYKAYQGDYAGQDLSAYAGGTSRIGSGNVPDIPNDVCPVALIKVVSTTGTFLPGTTNLDAANLTFTFYDLDVLPGTNP